MSNKFFSHRQQHMTIWILLFMILMLLGVVVFLQPGPAPDLTPAADDQPQAVATPMPETSEQNGWPIDRIALALQVAVGAGLIGYLIGYKRGQRRTLDNLKSSPPAASAAKGKDRDSTNSD